MKHWWTRRAALKALGLLPIAPVAHALPAQRGLAPATPQTQAQANASALTEAWHQVSDLTPRQYVDAMGAEPVALKRRIRSEHEGLAYVEVGGVVLTPTELAVLILAL